jgi:hypothetical protein
MCTRFILGKNVNSTVSSGRNSNVIYNSGIFFTDVEYFRTARKAR